MVVGCRLVLVAFRFFGCFATENRDRNEALSFFFFQKGGRQFPRPLRDLFACCFYLANPEPRAFVSDLPEHLPECLCLTTIQLFPHLLPFHSL